MVDDFLISDVNIASIFEIRKPKYQKSPEVLIILMKCVTQIPELKVYTKL